MSFERLAKEVKNVLGGLAREIALRKGYLEVLVDVTNIVEAAKKLKTMGLDHVKSVTATDYPKESKIRVTYHASSYSREELMGVIVGLSVDLPRDNPEMPSLVSVWDGSVEFQEREVYEFFGVIFRGHPDLRPLLLIRELADKKVLRKDFVVKEESIYEGVPFKYG